MMVWLRKNYHAVITGVSVAVLAALFELGVKGAAVRWPEATLAIVSLLMLSGLIVIGVFTNQGIDNATEAIRAAGEKTASEIQTAGEATASAVRDLRGIAPRVTYYSVHGKQGRAVLYEEAKKIVRNAKREIHLLNSSAEEAVESEVRTSRDEYFTLLEERSEQVVYSRVLQSRSFWSARPGASVADSFEENYVQHFRRMLDRQVSQSERGWHETELLVAPPTIPSTFLIADDNYLIWQLNEVRQPDERDTHWQIRGAIVIYDPSGEIIREFKATYKRARIQSRALTITDLSRTGATLDEA